MVMSIFFIIQGLVIECHDNQSRLLSPSLTGLSDSFMQAQQKVIDIPPYIDGENVYVCLCLFAQYTGLEGLVYNNETLTELSQSRALAV